MIHYKYNGHQHIWKQTQLTGKCRKRKVGQEKAGSGLGQAWRVGDGVWAWPASPTGLCAPDQKSLAPLTAFRISVSDAGLEHNLGLGNAG